MIVVYCQSELLEVVLALRSAGGFACLLDGGQQDGNKDRNNGDDDEKLDKSEAYSALVTKRRIRAHELLR